MIALGILRVATMWYCTVYGSNVKASTPKAKGRNTNGPRGKLGASLTPLPTQKPCHHPGAALASQAMVGPWAAKECLAVAKTHVVTEKKTWPRSKIKSKQNKNQIQITSVAFLIRIVISGVSFPIRRVDIVVFYAHAEDSTGKHTRVRLVFTTKFKAG